MNRIRKFLEQNRTYIAEAFQMAWPAVLESFCVALAGMVDSLMVSSIGAYAVAAVGLVGQDSTLLKGIFKWAMLVLVIACLVVGLLIGISPA